jgi:hypothetical protein
VDFGGRLLVRTLIVLVPLGFIAGLANVWAFRGADEFDLLTRTLGYASLVFWAATLAAAGVSFYRGRFGLRPPPAKESRYFERDEISALVLAAIALALFLAALGAVVLPGDVEAADTSGPASPTPMSLAIHWTVVEPLRVQMPGKSSPTQRPATVDFEVADSRHPACIGGEYRWTFDQEGSPADPQAITRRDACDAVADLEPGSVAHVRVTEGSATTDTTVTVRRLLIASFGDSVASGEGNPSHAKPEWEGERSCHRSAIAGPRQAAEKVAAAERHAVVTFFHLACTGAWIDDEGAPDKWTEGRPSLLPQHRGAHPSELEQFRGATPSSDGEPIVLLSVGANDLGFGPILTKCALPSLPGNCFDKKVAGTRVRVLVAERLAVLEASFGRLGAEAPFTASDVYLTQYFDPVHDEHGKFCGRLRALALSRGESELAEKLILVPLNDLLRHEANARHWRYVDGIASAFRPHGYCAKDSWIVQLHESLRNPKGIFHPNAEGQREYGERIFAALKPHLPPR